MFKKIPALLILGTALFLISCTKDSKPNQPVFDPYIEPSPEVESKIQLVINFDGKWKKDSTGSKAVIIIKGRSGRIIGKNGAEIPIIVRYINEKTVKIIENEYNPEYLANWLPETIARQIYNDDFLKKTYSILKIIDEDTLRGTSYAWQVYHNNTSVQKIESLVSSEEWKRVKD